MEESRILGTAYESDMERRRVTDGLLAALRGGEDAAVVLTGLDGSPHSIPADAPRRLGTALGEMVRVAATGVDSSDLVLAGGDTAYNVLSGLHVETVAVHGEIEPGVPLGTIFGGLADGKSLVTKAGGFGSSQTLYRIVRYIRNRRNRRLGV